MTIVRSFSFITLGLLITLQVYANNVDSFQPYAQVSMTHDDNLYKADKGQNLNVPSRSDTIRSFSAGINVNLDYSIQNFLLNAEATNTSYAKNSRFDNQGGLIKGVWNWKIGRQLSGKLIYDYSKVQASFVDNQNLALEGADKVNKIIGYNGNWLINPRWSAGIGLSRTTLDFINTDLDFNNRNTRNLQVNINHRTNKGSNFGFKISRDTTQFDNQNSVFTDSDYALTSYVFTTDWKASGKSTIRGQAGWESLKNKRLSERDFSDWSMNLTHIWNLTGKYNLTTKIWNEVTPSNTLIATYQRSKGIKMSATWNVTAKNYLTFTGERKVNDLEGDPGFITTTQQINDRFLTASTAWGYQPSDNIALQVGYQYSQRQSNIDNRDFKSNTIFGMVKGTW